MPTEIVIVVDDMRLNGYLDDSPTAQALADALPIDGRAFGILSLKVCYCKLLRKIDFPLESALSFCLRGKLASK